MLGRQAKVLEAFERSVQFVKTNVPPNANAKYAELSAELEKAVEQLAEDARDQVVGRRMGRAKTQSLRSAVKTLREMHLRPISMIGQALKREVPGIDSATRLPRRRQPVTKLAADARAVRDNAKRYEQLFVDSGRDPDFVAQLDAAITDIERLQLEQARALGMQVGATGALVDDIYRARQLETMLDCQILTGFADDQAKLAEWRSAKRVRAKSGASRDEAPIESEEVVAEVIEVPQPRLMVAA